MRDIDHAELLWIDKTYGNLGPCAKATVRCTITSPRGEKFTGENWCHNPQEVCPREPGENYDKCTAICQQYGHAELEALKLAGQEAINGTACLDGHSHYCKTCQEALFDAGVISLSRR